MIEDKELDLEIEKRAMMKKEQVVSFSQQSESEQNVDTKALVEKGVQAAVVHKFQSEQTVQDKLLKTADKIIDANIKKATNDAEKDEKRAVFENNKDACDLYGIDEKTVPKWVVGCAKRVQDIWYAVWLIIGFFTTAPVVFLSKKIKVVFKRTWVAVLLALLIYVGAVTSPLWLKYLQIPIS